MLAQNLEHIDIITGAFSDAQIECDASPADTYLSLVCLIAALVVASEVKDEQFDYDLLVKHIKAHIVLAKKFMA